MEQQSAETVRIKRCSKCKIDKDWSLFYKQSKSKDGLQSRCKECANGSRWKNGRFRDEGHKQAVLKSNRQSYQKHRESYVVQAGKRNAAYKMKGIIYLGSKCMKCGISHPAVLQFHHREPENKSFNVSTALCAPTKYPWEIMKTELDKCDLICSNCHDFHHNNRFYEGFAHDTWEVQHSRKDEAYRGEKS